jgi:hypothetical protein
MKRGSTMTDGPDAAPAGTILSLHDFRRATETVAHQLRRNAVALSNDLVRRQVEKKTRTGLDALEEKVMRETAALAAASGTPEQAKAMLRKARGKLMNAAANGADTATLEGMVRDFERLAKTAQQKDDAERALKIKT